MSITTTTVGVLALQGGFLEHLTLLHRSAQYLQKSSQAARYAFDFIEVRTPQDLARCDGLIIPGGESTTISLIAAESGLLEPLRTFVKSSHKPTWGTCAGLILLAEQANATKKGGQALIGGLAVRVHRNHFGRQIESFVADVNLPFLAQSDVLSPADAAAPFPGVFIRAPIVEQLLLVNGSGGGSGQQHQQAPDQRAEMDGAGGGAGGEGHQATIAAVEPGVVVVGQHQNDDADQTSVEILGVLPDRTTKGKKGGPLDTATSEVQGGQLNDIVAVRQGNIMGTSFHPELTDDVRIHVWWLEQVLKTVAAQP